MSQRWRYAGRELYVPDAQHGVQSNHYECRHCLVLRQCVLPREQRRIPAVMANVVYDRIYGELLASGQLRWVRTYPGCSGLGDYPETVLA